METRQFAVAWFNCGTQHMSLHFWLPGFGSYSKSVAETVDAQGNVYGYADGVPVMWPVSILDKFASHSVNGTIDVRGYERNGIGGNYNLPKIKVEVFNADNDKLIGTGYAEENRSYGIPISLKDVGCTGVYLKFSLEDEDDLVKVYDKAWDPNNVAWFSTPPIALQSTVIEERSQVRNWNYDPNHPRETTYVDVLIIINEYDNKVDLRKDSYDDVIFKLSGGDRDLHWNYYDAYEFTPKTKDKPAGDPSTLGGHERFAHMAIIYHNVYQGAMFAEEKLKQSMDLVKVHVFDSNPSKAEYRPNTQTIRIEKTESTFNYKAGDRPDNREFHEYGHHIVWQSNLGGAKHPMAFDGTNHGGLNNPTTADSFTEGIASFLAVLISREMDDPTPRNSNSKYRAWGNGVDLDGNFRYDDPNAAGAKPQKRMPAEEWLIASILWDLYDPIKRGTPDMIDMTGRELWKQLNVARNTNFFKFYETLSLLGGLDNYPTKQQLDNRMLAAGVYVDSNGNGKFDGGETIGKTSWNSTYPNREKPPPIAGTMMKFNVVDAQGLPISNSRLIINIEYDPPNDFLSFDEHFDLVGVGPFEMPLIMPVELTRAEILVYKNGYLPSQHTLSDNHFWRAVDPSQPGGPPKYLIDHTFVLNKKPTVTPPLKIDYFFVSPRNGDAPHTVSFSADISGGAPPYSWFLNFRDGNYVSGFLDLFFRTHTYEPSDIVLQSRDWYLYKPFLSVADSEGNYISKTRSVNVTKAQGLVPLVFDIVSNSTGGMPPHNASFQVITSGGTPEYLVTYDFGDGSEKLTVMGENVTRTHTFTSLGNYTVTVQVEDEYGFEQKDSVGITITNLNIIIPKISGPLSTDKKTYSLGDDVTVNVHLPYSNANLLVAISIINSNNDNIFTKTETLDIFGDASLKFRIGQNLPPGTHQIILTAWKYGPPLYESLSFIVS